MIGYYATYERNGFLYGLPGGKVVGLAPATAAFVRAEVREAVREVLVEAGLLQPEQTEGEQTP